MSWPHDPDPTPTDPTTEIPDLALAVPDNCIDVTEAGAHPGPAADQQQTAGADRQTAVDRWAQHAAVGLGSTLARVHRFWTVHPRAWKLADLRSAAASATEPAEISQAHAAYDQLAGELRFAMLVRRAVFVAGVLAAARAGWWLLGERGMWPLIVASAVCPVWYAAKGWCLVRFPQFTSRFTAQTPQTGPGRPGQTGAADPQTGLPGLGREPQTDPGSTPDQTGPDCSADQGGLVRGLLRLVPNQTGDPTGPVPVTQTTPAAPAPSGPPRPGWLTQTEIQRRMLNAHKPLRTATPLRATGDGEPVLVDLLDAEHMGNGWQLTLELPEDVTASKIMGLREDVARAFRVPAEQILMHVGAAHPGILVLWVCDTDPLRTTPHWSGIVDIDEVNLHDGYVLGEDLHGREIRYRPIGSHCLTTGRSRSGKSVLQKLKLAYLLMDPHHLVVIIDPNGGEWRGYRDVAIYFGGPDAMGDALSFVRHAVEVEIPRRARRLAELKELYPLRIPELKIPEWLARDPSEDMFALTIMIEEAPELFQGPDAEEWNDLLTRFSAQMLKYLGHLDLTFQRISNRAMGGKGVELRDLAGETAFCGSVRSESSARMALGDDWKRMGMNPLAIQPRVHAGTFVATGAALVLPPGVDHTLLKARFTDDSEGLLVRRKALELRRRVRPELLPEGWAWPAAPAPSAPPAPGPAPSSPDPAAETSEAGEDLDLEPLRRAVEILEPNGTMRATAVIAELGHRWPDDHGDISTVDDLNRLLLRPYGLRTKQWELPDGSGRPHQLRYSQCAARLKQLSERPDGH